MRRLAPLVLLLAAACAPPHPKPADEAALAPVGAHDETRIAEVYRQRTGPGGAGDYCLGPGDLLTVNVFAWDAMKDQQVRVSSSGSISLPMVGSWLTR